VCVVLSRVCTYSTEGLGRCGISATCLNTGAVCGLEQGVHVQCREYVVSSRVCMYSTENKLSRCGISTTCSNTGAGYVVLRGVCTYSTESELSRCGISARAQILVVRRLKQDVHVQHKECARSSRVCTYGTGNEPSRRSISTTCSNTSSVSADSVCSVHRFGSDEGFGFCKDWW
jgi:hypothetical protein